MKLIRILLKIILFPVSIALSIVTSFLTFLLSVSSIILGIVSFLCVIAAIGAFVQHDTVTGIQGLVIGFLLSPYGLQKLAMYIVAFIEAINEGIKAI